MGKNRRRIYALVGAVAVAGALLMVAPAFGDSHPDAVRLHLGTNGQYFEYKGTYQNLTSTRCEINELKGPVMALNADRKTVGLNSLGIGVKSGGAQGTPCGRVDTSETLTLSVPTGEGVLKGRFFDGARLDLELKGNARVIATLHNDTDGASRVFELGSGSSIEGGDVRAETNDDGHFWAVSIDTARNVACGAQSDSGPDAGPMDNCLWTIDTAFQFNRIVLTAKVGEFSLEGSGDFGNDPAFDSLFFIANAAPVAENDVYSTPQNTTLTVSATEGVLKNDTDADGDSLTAVLVDDVKNGVLSGPPKLASDGSFTYTPNAGFTGEDSFTYKANDGTDDSEIATVTINVTLECGEPSVFPGEGETYTVLPKNGGVDCTKDLIEYDAGVDGEGNPFVKLITSGDTTVVFLELLEIEARVYLGGAQTRSLEYDDDGSGLKLAPYCRVDPRAVNTTGEFDLHVDYDSAVEAGAVLPTGETTCIISAEFVTTGADLEGNPLVKITFWLYNLDDGVRTFK